MRGIKPKTIKHTKKNTRATKTYKARRCKEYQYKGGYMGVEQERDMYKK